MEINAMFKGLRLVAATALVIGSVYAAPAQRPRSMNQETDTATKTTPPAPAPAPQTVKAKYEGGVFGHNKKMGGTLSFDDTNSRLVFRDGKQKEILSFPYNSLTGAYGDTHSVQPAAATIASHIPYVGIPASFIKTKVRYLALQYNDPDSKVAGVTSFKLENKAILDSVLNTLAAKASLTPRGDIFVRKQQ
jgi:hypothetical protein